VMISRVGFWRSRGSSGLNAFSHLCQTRRVARSAGSRPCPYRKSDANVLVVQSAEMGFAMI
jgi:hypothetical protein